MEIRGSMLRSGWWKGVDGRGAGIEGMQMCAARGMQAVQAVEELALTVVAYTSLHCRRYKCLGIHGLVGADVLRLLARLASASSVVVVVAALVTQRHQVRPAPLGV